MESRRGDYLASCALQPEPQLPSGWEKCLDLKSGLIYFKDWNSGTLTYRDPRHHQAVGQLATQRIGLISISLSPELTNASDEGASKKPKRATPSSRLPWTLARDSSATETTTMTTSDDEHSLELSLNLPGTTVRALLPPNHEDSSVCTMEKVRRALERSNWLTPLTRKRSISTTLSTALSLLSSSQEANFPRLAPSDAACNAESSPSTSSQGSDSECFTSPSAMSYEGDDEEVQQQPRRGVGMFESACVPPSSSSSGEVMVTVGCQSCLMYVMLSKAHPCCPKCGNTDVLLQLPQAPVAKKHRGDESSSPTWSWCTA